MIPRLRGRPLAGLGLALERLGQLAPPFLAGCVAAVETEDLEALRSLRDTVDLIGDLVGQVVTANNGDLDGPADG
jgi:hypothetical protein